MNHEGMEVKGEDQEKLATALGTIAEVLVGRELESVRNSTAGLNSKLSSCVDALKEETTRAMDEMQDRVTSRIDEMLAKLAEAEENRDKVVADLETRIGQLQEQLQAVKEDLAKNDLESVSENVTALQEKLQRQQANTERISTTLGSLANVLSGTAHAHPPVVQPPAPEPVPVEAVTDLPPAEPTQPNAAVEAVSQATESGEIDNVLDRAFGGD
jgi:uncharacterized phage infection (PIP) family protein YhgE